MASKFVLLGPYRLVRNSMPLAGIMQGVAVGGLLGSYLVITYAHAGALVWHYLVHRIDHYDL